MARAAVKVKTTGGAAGRMFLEQAERLAAAWRRERYLEAGRSTGSENLFEAVVENFVRQVGLAMLGETSRPWATTRGVLRLSVTRGEQGVLDELSTLRRCLLDAMAVVGMTDDELAVLESAVSDAAVYALAHLRRLNDPDAPTCAVPFGGLVVELIEPQRRAPVVQSAREATVH